MPIGAGQRRRPFVEINAWIGDLRGNRLPIIADQVDRQPAVDLIGGKDRLPWAGRLQAGDQRRRLGQAVVAVALARRLVAVDRRLIERRTAGQREPDRQREQSRGDGQTGQGDQRDSNRFRHGTSARERGVVRICCVGQYAFFAVPLQGVRIVESAAKPVNASRPGISPCWHPLGGTAIKFLASFSRPACGPKRPRI